jgi:DNA primase
MSSSQINQVKESSDIIAIINERIPLQRSGQNYRANCPFHGEKTPSFFVSEAMQRYKCFGCGETGDVFTFLEKYENMTFSESLQFLAERAGIKLQEFKHTAADDEREQLVAILNLTKEYYHYILQEHQAGEVARQYLKQRGVTQESIKIFQLGFSVESWDGLLSYLHHKKKYPLALIDKAGLIVKGKGGRYYDRFRNRVMFPLTNHRGQVVGFSGRTLDPDAKTAKYINSPETTLYHKSELLFGYSQLRQFIREQQTVVVVEGELDVSSSAQAHVNNVVGLKGSALTEQQAGLLDRVAQKVVLSLDADKAGIEATKRAITVSAKRGYELRVIILPEGKDPDQLAKTKPDVWRQTVKQSVSVPDFFLTVLQAQHDVSTPEGKREVMKEMIPVLRSIEHAVERDFYIKKLATVLAVRESVVREDLRQAQVKRPALNGDAQNPSRSSGGISAEMAGATQHGELRPTIDPVSPLERQLLAVLLFNEKLTAERLAELSWQQATGMFKSLLNQLFEHLATLKASQTNFALAKWSKTLAADQQQLITDIIVDPSWDFSNADQTAKVWQQLKTKWHQEQVQQTIEKITQELNQLDDIDQKNPEQEQRQQQLLAEVVKLRTAS